jgi:hypothetical protein
LIFCLRQQGRLFQQTKANVEKLLFAFFYFVLFAPTERIKAYNVKKAHVYNSLEQEDRVNLATL